MADYSYIRVLLNNGYTFNTSTPTINFALDTNGYVPITITSVSGRTATGTIYFGGNLSAGSHTFKLKLYQGDISGLMFNQNLGLVSYLMNSNVISRDTAGGMVKIDANYIGPGYDIGGSGTVVAN